MKNEEERMKKEEEERKKKKERRRKKKEQRDERDWTNAIYLGISGMKDHSEKKKTNH